MREASLVEETINVEKQNGIYEVCQLGKQVRLPFLVNKAWRAQEKLQLVHYDVENQTSCKLKKVRSDNGIKYTSDKFQNYCKVVGIHHQLTNIYTQQQNRVCERKNKIVMGMLGNVIGYSNNRNGYRAYDPSSKKILANRDVVFDEVRTWNWDATEAKQRMDELGSQNHYDDGELGSQSGDEISNTKYNDTPVRGMRLIGEIYQQADVALLKPLNNLKARLVVKGFNQQCGIDYWETFTPVVRLDMIRLLFALAAQMGCKIHQLDVKLAFLNGYLQE
ncbi:Integrase, catalytic core [Gossypium australe]|uniref:Integrase, catalytic core n=1 Tax=Gossypium australe TaxID=47621 RepID=A0A5B6WKS3_9ROSI|nr:Integrase, catalytic core [Gossypium australe]